MIAKFESSNTLHNLVVNIDISVVSKTHPSAHVTCLNQCISVSLPILLHRIAVPVLLSYCLTVIYMSLKRVLYIRTHTHIYPNIVMIVMIYFIHRN